MDAPAGLLPLSRPLMTGEVLDAAFRLFRAGLLRCLPYSGLAVLAIEFPTFYSTFLSVGISGGISGGNAAVGTHLDITVYAVFFVFLAFLLGVITLRLQAIARGNRPSFRREVGTAFRRWPLALVATGGAIGLPVLLALVATLDFGSRFIVMLVFAVPVLWPTSLLILALPAYWGDRLGPFAAVARAVSLSRRRSWRMLGALLATACMVSSFYVLSAIVAGLLSQLIGAADLFLIAAVSSMLSLVIGALGVPFVIAMLIVAYEDLKRRDDERRGAQAVTAVQS
jgi:hypothetical protein